MIVAQQIVVPERGGLFLNLIGRVRVEFDRRARSTQPLGDSRKVC